MRAGGFDLILLQGRSMTARDFSGEREWAVIDRPYSLCYRRQASLKLYWPLPLL